MFLFLCLIEYFFSRNVTFIFDKNKSEVVFFTKILNDNIPELKENFFVLLSSKDESYQISKKIDILENDFYEGKISFFDNPAYIYTEENKIFNISVRRKFGTFFETTIFWEIENGVGDFFNFSGMVIQKYFL